MSLRIQDILNKHNTTINKTTIVTDAINKFGIVVLKENISLSPKEDTQHARQNDNNNNNTV